VVAAALAAAPAVALPLVVGAAIGLAPGAAWAAPDAGKVRQAAEEFDEAVRLYKAKDFAAAAAHFEAADGAVPSPKALRLAIRSRTEAGQLARAATLAAYAIDRYPAETETADTARETLAKHRAALHEVKVSCQSLCILAVQVPGDPPRSVHGAANTRWTVYLEPGESVISGSFVGDLPAGQETVLAKAGGSSSLRFDAGDGAPRPAPPAAPPPSPAASGEAPAEAPPSDEVDDGGLPPWVFLGGAVLTAGAAGVTIWSGIDTMNDPGEDGVRAGCAGQGTECALYQDGLAKETRTNVLIGVTAGLGAATLVLALLTDWDGDADAAPEVGLGPVRLGVPVVGATPRGGALAASGRF
jgi:hypothetical protein